MRFVVTLSQFSFCHGPGPSLSESAFLPELSSVLSLSESDFPDFKFLSLSESALLLSLSQVRKGSSDISVLALQGDSTVGRDPRAAYGHSWSRHGSPGRHSDAAAGFTLESVRLVRVALQISYRWRAISLLEIVIGVPNKQKIPYIHMRCEILKESPSEVACSSKQKDAQCKRSRMHSARRSLWQCPGWLCCCCQPLQGCVTGDFSHSSKLASVFFKGKAVVQRPGGRFVTTRRVGEAKQGRRSICLRTRRATATQAQKGEGGRQGRASEVDK
eukprot:g78332.t1